MRLCSYVVKNDTGFAPNPFWGYCTLAACTPNHMGVRLQEGDWILGHQTVAQGNGLVYAMQVDEALCFDKYFGDGRFNRKKPLFGRTWKESCGDNIYVRDSRGRWRQHRSAFHTSPGEVRKDVKHPIVFVGRRFYYFGKKAVRIPDRFSELIWHRQGCSCKHNRDIVRGFVKWLSRRYDEGIHGLPAHRRKITPCRKAALPPCGTSRPGTFDCR